MKILFIGAGNMAQAMINGIINKSVFKPDDIYIYEINNKTKKDVCNKYKTGFIDNCDKSITDFDIIILAVKPQVFLNFKTDNEMKKMPELLKPDQLIISIMAGINIISLKAFFNKTKSIIRTMPNTPALIGQAMSVISYSPDTNETKGTELDQIAEKIFSSIGKVEIADEKYIDAVTALSGSGPAYVFTFIEALTQGGVLCGLSKKTAEKLAVQTVLGSAMMINEGQSLEELRHMVTSPGGTTISGLAALEKNSFRYAVIEAVKSAFERAKELSGTK